ncbi:50S ribosomal protein L20 [bacterium]|nr:MAG: 50S ribosomal protein L20 [bacterium]
MTRIKRGNVARRRRQKTLKLSSGFRGSSGTLFRTANQHVLKAQKNTYRDRIQRKRSFRNLWITRMNAAIRGEGLSYSQFIHLTKQSRILLNRKIISQLAILDKDAFRQLVLSVQ